MGGDNLVGGELPVFEVFASIQGESSHAGRPCFFIRLAGCNLDCAYCDTRMARNPRSGRTTAVSRLVELALASGLGLVEITGGEPMIHAATPALGAALLRAGLEVLMETNGSLPLDSLPAGVARIVDCKTPSSGHAASNHLANFAILGRRDEVKFVISDRLDYEFARGIALEHDLSARVACVLFSPAAPTMPPTTLAAWMLEDKLKARLQLQIHKIIWPRGEPKIQVGH